MNYDLAVENRSQHPTGLVLDLIDFATRELRVDDVGFLVVHENRGLVSGLAQPYPRRTFPFFNRRRFAITLRIGDQRHAPASNMQTVWRKDKNGEYVSRTRPYGGKYSVHIEYKTWQEALVAVARHEMEHIVRFRAYYEGERRRNSEAACERASAETLMDFRSGQYPILFRAYATEPPTIPKLSPVVITPVPQRLLDAAWKIAQERFNT